MIAKLKNILRCYAVGMGIKETANTFHLSRNTVRKYVRLFISSGKTTEQLLELSEEHLREMFGCAESSRPVHIPYRRPDGVPLLYFLTFPSVF